MIDIWRESLLGSQSREAALDLSCVLRLLLWWRILGAQAGKAAELR